MSDLPPSYRARLARVVAAIVADPDRAWRLDELAALAHFSPFHFHRIYRGTLGETVADTIRRLRLARAAARIEADAGRVTAIGQDAGYDSPQAFSRAFRQFTGSSPRAFRRRMDDIAAGAPLAIVERPALRLVTLAHRGPYGMIPHTHRQLGRLLAGHRVGDWYGISHGDPALDGEPAYFVGAVVDDGCVPAGCAVQALAGGRYACHTLVGPYTLIGPALNALYANWLPASGHEPDERPLLEFYHAPADPADPASFRTDLLVPVL